MNKKPYFTLNEILVLVALTQKPNMKGNDIVEWLNKNKVNVLINSIYVAARSLIKEGYIIKNNKLYFITLKGKEALKSDITGLIAIMKHYKKKNRIS